MAPAKAIDIVVAISHIGGHDYLKEDRLTLDGDPAELSLAVPKINLLGFLYTAKPALHHLLGKPKGTLEIEASSLVAKRPRLHWKAKSAKVYHLQLGRKKYFRSFENFSTQRRNFCEPSCSFACPQDSRNPFPHDEAHLWWFRCRAAHAQEVGGYRPNVARWVRVRSLVSPRVRW